jgi:hypothetical protein
MQLLFAAQKRHHDYHFGSPSGFGNNLQSCGLNKIINSLRTGTSRHQGHDTEIAQKIKIVETD